MTVKEVLALARLTVNLTARICAFAKPDQILVAYVIRELCVGKKFSFENRGEVTLKGFKDAVRLFEVLWEMA